MLHKGHPDSILLLFGRGRRARVFARASRDPRGACSKPDDSSANCGDEAAKNNAAGRPQSLPAKQTGAQQCECAIARCADEKALRSSNKSPLIASCFVRRTRQRTAAAKMLSK
jgi:hypothetical protein